MEYALSKLVSKMSRTLKINKQFRAFLIKDENDFYKRFRAGNEFY